MREFLQGRAHSFFQHCCSCVLPVNRIEHQHLSLTPSDRISLAQLLVTGNKQGSRPRQASPGHILDARFKLHGYIVASNYQSHQKYTPVTSQQQHNLKARVVYLALKEGWIETGKTRRNALQHTLTRGR